MKIKTQQFITRYRYTASNRIPALRARQFLNNYLRQGSSYGVFNAKQNTASTLALWKISSTNFKEHRVAQRTKCIITGRNRGVSARFNVARRKLKSLSNAGQLFGVRKSSW